MRHFPAALPPELTRHVEACASCRRFLETARTAAHALQEDPEPPRRLDEAVLAMARREAASRRRPRVSWLAPLAAAAALLVVFLGARIGHRAPDRPPSAPAQGPVPAVVGVTALNPELSWQDEDIQLAMMELEADLVELEDAL